MKRQLKGKPAGTKISTLSLHCTVVAIEQPHPQALLDRQTCLPTIAVERCPMMGLFSHSSGGGGLLGAKPHVQGEPSGVRALRLSSSNIQPLPTEEPRIQRPDPRADQCQGGTEGSQHDPAPRRSGREDMPQRLDGYQRSSDRGPKTCDQQGPETHRAPLQQGGSEGWFASQHLVALNEERGTGHHAHEQESNPGEPVGKVGEKATHCAAGYRLQLRAETLDRADPETLSGALRTR